jgi:hypothetical protein
MSNGERTRQHSLRGGRVAAFRWRLAPLLGISAVAAVALAMAMLAPAQHPGTRRTGLATHQSASAARVTASVARALPSAAAEPKFMITNPRGFSPLKVHDAATGKLVALVKVPKAPLIVPDLHTRRHFQIESLATPNGRRFVVGLYRAIPCTSRFYQFTLGPRGKPGRLTPLASLPVIRGAGIGSMAFSANGREFAFSTVSGSPACAYKVTSSHIGVVNLVSGKVTQWSGFGGPLSLNSNGTLLAYGGGQGVMGIPTAAPPGPAAKYSRVLISAAPYRRIGGLIFAAITPDGKHVVFSLYPERVDGPGPGQIRMGTVGSSHSRLVASHLGYEGLIAADPLIRELLVYKGGKLVRVDLSSGRITPMPTALRGFVGEIFW